MDERDRIAGDLRDRNRRLALANEIARTDLRNDLSVIVGLSDQLRDRVEPEEREVVDSVLAASQHALELTDAVAELVDLLAGAAAPTGRSCDLRALVERTADSFRRENEADLTVDSRVPADDPLAISGSPMLAAAFEHLFRNAATRTNRDTVGISVTIEATGERVSVVIADDGHRIPDARKAAIVEPELGIGDCASIGTDLFFVRTVLEGVGGDLSIEDGDPRGTVVTVTLDRSADH